MSKRKYAIAGLDPKQEPKIFGFFDDTQTAFSKTNLINIHGGYVSIFITDGENLSQEQINQINYMIEKYNQIFSEEKSES